jgi:hypothetical protein
MWRECLPKEGYETIETKEKRCRALNGQIRPLTLGLQAYMRVAFLEGSFKTPAFHKIEDNLLGCLALIG